MATKSYDKSSVVSLPSTEPELSNPTNPTPVTESQEQPKKQVFSDF